MSKHTWVGHPYWKNSWVWFHKADSLAQRFGSTSIGHQLKWIVVYISCGCSLANFFQATKFSEQYFFCSMKMYPDGWYYTVNSIKMLRVTPRRAYYVNKGQLLPPNVHRLLVNVFIFQCVLRVIFNPCQSAIATRFLQQANRRMRYRLSLETIRPSLRMGINFHRFRPNCAVLWR